MILDDGICTVFRRTDIAEGGGMPQWAHAVLHRSWFKVLDFSSVPTFPTEDRKELQIDLRIRIMQNVEIRQHDVVILRRLADYSERGDNDKIYSIERAYHGKDDDRPTPITDLSLREVSP